jgi:hypothetical protein
METESSEALAANTRSRQRRSPLNLLPLFYYILATLTFMFKMVQFFVECVVRDESVAYWFESNVGSHNKISNAYWLVGALSMFAVGRVIAVLQQIRDAVRS